MTAEQSPQSTPYDATYKACFSDPRMVESLLRVYADQDLVEGMDFSSLTPYPTEFVTPMLGSVRDDCIWKAKFHGKDCYVLIVLEFQSTIDRFMAARVLAYIACLWLHIQKAEKLGNNDTLPPVFPVVIYNGKQEWNAPTSCVELIGNLPNNLRPYQGLRYYLLDIGRIAENLVRDGKGSAAVLVRLERATTPEEYIAVIKEIGTLRHDPANRQLCEILNTYFKVLAMQSGVLNEVAEQASLEGGENTMLLENLQEMAANLRAEGEAKGRSEGVLSVVLNMLRKQFSFAQISELTGYSEPEVERIARENGFSAA